MAASSTFESSLRRGNPSTTTTSRKTTPPASSSDSSKRAATAPPRRSRSVSAFSRTSHSDFSEFSIKRDNPLFDNNGNGNDNDDDEAVFLNCILKSDQATSKTKLKAVAADDYGNRRGRSTSRNGPDGKHLSGSGNSKELSRSLSVVDTRRRGRSVSRTPLSRTHLASSASHSKTAKWNDAVSTSSFSDTELTESFQGDNLVGDATAASDIYRTVKSEVRWAISDIQNELECAIRRSNATSDPDAVELVSDVQQEYAIKLEQSQERARQLRADLAIEEQRGKELSRILKEVLLDAKTPNTMKSRLGRKSSIERRKISKCLTDDALAYFDECVSLSTFDDSDFSSLEDPPLKLVGVGTLEADGLSLQHANSSIPAANIPSNHLHDKQECQFAYSHDPLDLTTGNGGMEQTQDRFSLNSTDGERSQKFQFSFSPKLGQVCELQQDIKKYVEGFEKDTRKVGIDSQITRRNSYDPEDYSMQASQQRLLFDHVFLKSRIESGSLLLCNGGCIAGSFLPFASVI